MDLPRAHGFLTMNYERGEAVERLECHVYGVPPTEEGHAHAYAHILLPLTQDMTVQLDGHVHEISSRHLGFVAPHRFHHCACGGEIIMINIPESIIKEHDIEILASKACLPLTGELVPLVELIKAEVRNNPRGDSVRYLYYFLYDKLVEHNGIKSIRHIREHYHREISIGELARLEGYHPTYFTGWFRRQTGQSPTAYIRQMRIDKAKELLEASRFRLIDIALQVGYSSDASFSRAFKEAEGITPAEYRKRMLE